MAGSNYFPKTVDEAIDWLIAELDDEALQKVRDCQNLVHLLFDLGLFIRNRLLYKSDGEELMADARKIYQSSIPGSEGIRYPFFDPDAASSLILQELQKRLQEESPIEDA